MKRLLFASALAAMCCSRAWADAGVLPIDGYAAMVNDRVITVSEVMAYVQPADQQLRDVYSGIELQKKREAAFESGRQALIDRALILEDFKMREKQTQLPDRVINDRINELINEKFQNDRSAFQQALIDEQITMDEWREETKERIIVSIVRRQEITDRVRVSPSQIKALYESRIEKYSLPARVNLNAIVINVGKDDADKNAKRQQAVVARGKLLAGEDFASVARDFSEGSRSAEGGSWGWIELSGLREELKKGIQGLKEGDVSDVIEAGDAYYILSVNQRKNAEVVPLDQVSGQLEAEIKQSESDRLYSQWMERLRRKHYVQVF